MKTEDKNVYEPEPKRHYKKRYLLRKLEEQEAEQEIVSFDLNVEIETNDTDTTKRNSNSLG